MSPALATLGGQGTPLVGNVVTPSNELFSLEIGRHDPPLVEVFRHALVYGKECT